VRHAEESVYADTDIRNLRGVIHFLSFRAIVQDPGIPFRFELILVVRSAVLGMARRNKVLLE
jgi:hypothetical protein